MTGTEKLQLIQAHLNSPKGRRNEFAQFNYRSGSDILAAVKPLLAEHKMTLTISDDIVHIEGRWYVKATATISDGEWSESVTSYAREAETKKGMDEAQITGCASSYARKYALAGLLAIDDEEDIDSMDNREPAQKQQKQTQQKQTQQKQNSPKQQANQSAVQYVSEENLKILAEKIKGYEHALKHVLDQRKIANTKQIPAKDLSAIYADVMDLIKSLQEEDQDHDPDL